MSETGQMRLELPQITFENGKVLHAGVLREGPLSLAHGQLVEARGKSVDLTGFAAMPGGIDLGGEAAPADQVPGSKSLENVSRAAAETGATTVFVGLNWTRAAAPQVREALADCKITTDRFGVDLRPRIYVGSRDLEGGDALLAAVQDTTGAMVVFVHHDHEGRPVAERDARGMGAVARNLADLAAAFDRLGIRYGSEGDIEAETREWMSMSGARMVLRPGARRAAATARAMGEPIVLSASDVLTGGTVHRGLQAALLGEGLCDALGTFGNQESALRSVQGLVASGRMPLGHAWALISSAPAAVMRLSDRGGLVAGTRADVTILDEATLAVAGTIAAGRLIYAKAEFLARLEDVFAPDALAAE